MNKMHQNMQITENCSRDNLKPSDSGACSTFIPYYQVVNVMDRLSSPAKCHFQFAEHLVSIIKHSAYCPAVIVHGVISINKTQ